MAILYDVPEGKYLAIQGPCSVTIKGAAEHPSIADMPDPPDPPPQGASEARAGEDTGKHAKHETHHRRGR
jgi:hypothetical protein